MSQRQRKETKRVDNKTCCEIGIGRIFSVETEILYTRKSGFPSLVITDSVTTALYRQAHNCAAPFDSLYELRRLSMQAIAKCRTG